MDRLDHGVGRCRQEAVDVMWARCRLGLRATVALDLGTDTGEGTRVGGRH